MSELFVCSDFAEKGIDITIGLIVGFVLGHLGGWIRWKS